MAEPVTAVTVHLARCATRTLSGPVEIQGADAYEVCLVRRGAFSYRDERGSVLVDPTTCILGTPGQTGEVSHPVSGGDESTALLLPPALVTGLLDQEAGAVPLAAQVTPAMLLVHRELVAAVRTQADPLHLEEVALALLSAARTQLVPARVAAGRPGTARARKDLVADAKAALMTEPAPVSVVDLAVTLGWSPHHVSRVFRQQTGMTLSDYRLQLRLNMVLEHLDGSASARTLAETAVQCGFADHAHLTRTVRRVLGCTPSELRARLRGPTTSRRPTS